MEVRINTQKRVANVKENLHFIYIKAYYGFFTFQHNFDVGLQHRVFISIYLD